MLGYSQFDKSINGIKTITDGKIIIQNGDIKNCNTINTTNHNCNELSLIKDGITISTDEFLTLNGINTNSTIQSQFNGINTQYNNLQSQITTINNVNLEQSANITVLQGNILTINNINSLQNSNITLLQSNVSTLQSNITSINTLNNTQNTRLTTIENSALYNLNIGNVITNTLSAGTNANVVANITQPTSNPNNKNINFTFNIPQGSQGIQGIQGIQGNSIVWKGQWDNNSGATYYYKNDISYYGGSSYICLGNKDNRELGTNIDVNPRDNPDEWQMIVQKGDRGSDGSNGNSGLNEFLEALGLAGLIGGSALAILAGVLSITENATSLQNGIDDLNNDIDASNSRISELEQKTQQQSATVGRTNFRNIVNITNTITGDEEIILDASSGTVDATYGDISFVNSQEVNADIVRVSNSLEATGNATIGTFPTSTISINGSSIEINGYLTINGIPYVPYTPFNFFQQY